MLDLHVDGLRQGYTKNRREIEMLAKLHHHHDLTTLNSTKIQPALYKIRLPNFCLHIQINDTKKQMQIKSNKFLKSLLGKAS